MMPSAVKIGAPPQEEEPVHPGEDRPAPVYGYSQAASATNGSVSSHGTNGTPALNGIPVTNGIPAINGTNGIPAINGTNGIPAINGMPANNGTPSPYAHGNVIGDSAPASPAVAASAATASPAATAAPAGTASPARTAATPERGTWPFDPLAEKPTDRFTLSQKTREINDFIGTNGTSSLNDRLKSDIVELKSALNDAPVRDLRKAIGINDRYVFINQLFRGDEVMYERSLKTINGFRILPEAEYWMERELKVKLGWDENREATRQFYQLVKRRFS